MPSNGLMGGMMLNLTNGMMQAKPERSPCVWVTGLPDEYVNADILCNIFGNYGNVRRISFTKKKADGALIEMDTPRRAENCCRYLNNVRMGGNQVMVKPSKIERVIVTPNDDKGSKDFKGARVGRFNKDKEGKFAGQDSKFTRIVMKRLSEPTTIILVSNIPEGKAVNDVKKYITEAGHTIKEFEEGKPREPKDEKEAAAEKAAPRKFKMAFVQVASPEEAVSAVGKLHNTKPAKWGEIEGYRGLKFSFTSKRDMKPIA
jgi:hypothetical protein